MKRKVLSVMLATGEVYKKTDSAKGKTTPPPNAQLLQIDSLFCDFRYRSRFRGNAVPLFHVVCDTDARQESAKSAENAALMPHIIMICLSFSSKPNSLPRPFPMLPPSCSAAPSRPAEPPNRWGISVEIKMRGAIRFPYFRQLFHYTFV